MTIRSGGRPRDQRPGVRRFEPDAYATDYVPEGYEPSRRYGGEVVTVDVATGAVAAWAGSSGSCSSLCSSPGSSSSWR